MMPVRCFASVVVGRDSVVSKTRCGGSSPIPLMGLSSGARVDALISSCCVALIAIFWARSSLVAGYLLKN